VIRTRRFLRQLPAVTLLLTLSFVGGCGDTPTEPAPTFQKTDLRVGSGPQAEAGDVLRVFYTGWIYDSSRPDQKGLQFETNVGGNPLTFTLGRGEVIIGWDEGLLGVQLGTIRRLVIPPDRAYGSSRRGPIPPNSTLIFEVEVAEIIEQ
jgi:FKBP-type peptidyl-prolyl cis-trans isomerase FkpA